MLLPNLVVNVVVVSDHLKDEVESINRVHLDPSEIIYDEIYGFYVDQIYVRVCSVVAPCLALHLRVDLDDDPLADYLV